MITLLAFVVIGAAIYGVYKLFPQPSKVYDDVAKNVNLLEHGIEKEL